MKKLALLPFIMLLVLTLFQSIVFANVYDKVILVAPETTGYGSYYLVKNSVKLLNLSPDKPYVLQFDLIEYHLTKAEKYDLIEPRIKRGLSLKGWDNLDSLLISIQLDVNRNKTRYVTMFFYDKDSKRLDILPAPELWIDNTPESINQKASLAAVKYYLETHPPIKGSTL